MYANEDHSRNTYYRLLSRMYVFNVYLLKDCLLLIMNEPHT